MHLLQGWNGLMKPNFNGIGGMGGSPMTGIECRWEERQSPVTDGGDI